PARRGGGGGGRAPSPGGVLDSARRAGSTGKGPPVCPEPPATGEQAIDLPTGSPPYAAMIDHVLACLTGHTGNLIEPASALPALELTLDVHQRLTRPH